MSEMRSLDCEVRPSAHSREPVPSLGSTVLEIVERLHAKLRAEHYDDIDLCAAMAARMEELRQAGKMHAPRRDLVVTL